MEGEGFERAWARKAVDDGIIRVSALRGELVDGSLCLLCEWYGCTHFSVLAVLLRIHIMPGHQFNLYAFSSSMWR